MNIKQFRQRFPEYGDLTDSELADVAYQMLNDLSETPEAKYCETVNVPGVESAVAEVAMAVQGVDSTVKEVSSLVAKANTLLANVNTSVKALDKPDKEEADMSPLLIGLGVQLSKIEEAIKAIDFPAFPEPAAMPEIKMCVGFKVVRDELGNIDKVIPEY